MGTVTPIFQTSETFYSSGVINPSHFQVNIFASWNESNKSVSTVYQIMDGDDVMPTASLSQNLIFATARGTMTLVDANTVTDHWESAAEYGVNGSTSQITSDCQLTRQTTHAKTVNRFSKIKAMLGK